MKRMVVGWCAGMLVLGTVAEQYTFVGHRSMGMGGANAASVNDSSAQWHNPAAFGFFNREADPVDGMITNAITNAVFAVTNAVASAETADTNRVAEAGAAVTNAAPANPVAAAHSASNETYDITYEAVPAKIVPERARVDNGRLEEHYFGWNLIGLGAGYTLTDEMPEYIVSVGEIDFDAFGGDGLDGTAEGVKSMILLGNALYGLGSNPENAFYVDATAGMNFRMGHLGLGIRAFSEAVGFIDQLDTTNLGVGQDLSEFVTEINNAAALDAGFDSGTWSYQTINPGDLTAISGEDADAELYIDYQLTQLKNDGVLTQEMIDDSVDMINLITFGQDPADPGSTSYENNTSTVMARGFGLVEIPVSYGYAFSDHLSVGVTAKGMYGTVTGTKIRFANGDAFQDSLDNMEENTKASLNLGLDLGLLYRMKMLQFAAVAHNINAPKFKGFRDTIEITNDNGAVVATVPIDVPDYTIDPQITLGAAFIPAKRFILEMSYDLLKTGTLLDGYDIQRISFGTELDIWLLAFRLGLYNNLAADWQDWVATGGVGLNLWLMRVDVGAAYSIGANAEYQGTQIPEEARVYAALSFEF